MDWLKSAIEADGDSDEDSVQKSTDVEIPKVEEVHSTENESELTEKESETKSCRRVDLFSFQESKREVEDLKVDNFVKISVPECSETISKVPYTSHNEQAPPKNIAEFHETLDCSEVLQRFNIPSGSGNISIPKSREWEGSTLSVTDIRAEDLRLSKEEKDKMFSNSKEALMEGRITFKIPTRLLETDDGQILTTTVARKTQKRKHQINWLAMEAQENELKLLERSAQMRKTKHETQMKYGW